MTQHATTSDRILIRQLREIILRDDREQIGQTVATLENPLQFKQKMNDPFNELYDQRWNQDLPALNQRIIRMVDEQILAKREEILTMIAPMLGEMVMRYVQLQMQLLQEKVEQQINAVVNQGWIQRLRIAIFGVSKAEVEATLAATVDNEVQEVFILEKNSGLLVGSASREDVMDSDLIGGMLTAIKSFVEDAFLEKPQKLDLIQYEHYTIAMHDYHQYYIAVVSKGILSSGSRVKMDTQVRAFADEIAPILYKKDFSRNYEIRSKIQSKFW